MGFIFFCISRKVGAFFVPNRLQEVNKMTKLLTPEQEAIRLAKNAYNREWRKKNPDKVKAAQERYWNKKAANSKKTTNN